MYIEYRRLVKTHKAVLFDNTWAVLWCKLKHINYTHSGKKERPASTRAADINTKESSTRKGGYGNKPRQTAKTITVLEKVDTNS